MLILFALLYPFLAGTGLLDNLPSFSEFMSGAFWAPYLGAFSNANIDYKNLLNTESLQAFMPAGYTPLKHTLPFLNESLLAQAKAKFNEKRGRDKKDKKQRQNNANNAINRRNRQRSGVNNKDIKRHMVLAKRGSSNNPYFVKRNRLAMASRNMRNQNSQVDPRQFYRRAILRKRQDTRRDQNTKNIDNTMNRNRGRKVVKVIRKIVVTTEKVDSIDTENDNVATEKYLSLIETNENLNKSVYTVTNESNHATINTTTNSNDSIVTDNNAWDKVEVDHTRSFQFGNNTMVKEESTYEGEVLVQGI